MVFAQHMGFEKRPVDQQRGQHEEDLHARVELLDRDTSRELNAEEFVHTPGEPGREWEC